MPELPDVEVYRRYFDATALHQRISGVRVPSPRLLSGTSPQGLGQVLHGRKFHGTHRHGKYLFAAIGGDRHLVLHFGMTGGLDYWSVPRDPPRFTACLLEFDNAAKLAYISPRKLGQVSLTGRVEKFVEDHDLGPDALALCEEDFRDLAEARRGSIKSWLMNQSVMAGIGNVYSDEMLFQAGIHPRTPVASLDESGLGDLYEAMVSVAHDAIRAHADPEAMPGRFLLPHRREGGRCPGCAGEVERLEISGRTAWYCPGCQPAP